VNLPDVDVLVLAHRRDHDEHDQVRTWLEGEVNSDSPFALANLAVSRFLRIVTNPRIYQRPTKLATAIEFVDGLVEQPTCVAVSAGSNHWPIFRSVLAAADARGNLVPDAHLAALAIEHGATIATRDRGFARFGDVRWLDPVG
jgi:toxin-antitoxin system PIN domain toxin